MTDRDTLEQVAASYNNLLTLQAQQKATMAKMIRACLFRLKSTNVRERKEATDALATLAEMLEGESAKV